MYKVLMEGHIWKGSGEEEMHPKAAWSDLT
jgi:hypothetical protein